MTSQRIGELSMGDYESMSKSLKPCPFCGGPALMKVYHHVPMGYDYTPTCTDKSCAGRLTKRWTDINLAVNAWNKRTETSVQEPKTGHWIDGVTLIGAKICRCSECNFIIQKPRIKDNFCPNCGLRMEE